MSDPVDIRSARAKKFAVDHYEPLFRAAAHMDHERNILRRTLRELGKLVGWYVLRTIVEEEIRALEDKDKDK